MPDSPPPDRSVERKAAKGARARRLVGAVRGVLVALLYAVAALVPFLFALRLLGTAAEAAAPQLQRVFESIGGGPPLLGAAWLATYATLNGSVIAAIAVGLSTALVIDPGQLILMITGSRLGAAAFVVLVGAVEHARRRALGWRRPLGIGVLALLVTHAVYLPAMFLAYVSGPLTIGPLERLAARAPSLDPPGAGWVSMTITELIGAPGAVLLALVLMFGGLAVADRGLGRLDQERLRAAIGPILRRDWASFIAGLVITVLAASISFSAGILVPLYARDLVRTREVILYLLGANIGTLADTATASLVLGASTPIAVVFLLAACVILVTAAALGDRERFSSAVEAALQAVTRGRITLFAFATVLVGVPLVLVAWR